VNEAIFEETLSVKEAADASGVHYMSIYRWIYEGILPAVKTKTGRYRIKIDDLRSVLEPETVKGQK